MAKVGVITRTTSRPLLLKRAIRSVLDQSLDDWTHVILNDGGDAETVDALVAESGGAYDGRVSVVHNEKSAGMEAASNRAIESCESEYLVIHDDDDSWEPRFLEDMIRSLEDLNDAERTKGIVCHSTRIIEEIKGDAIVEKKRDPFNDWLINITLFRMLESNMFSPISFLFERAAYDEVGPFREDLPVLGDWEFHIRFLMKYDIALLPKPLANYHHRVVTDRSVYGNTVTAQNDTHVYYRARLLNEWLREDLAEGRLGLGYLANCGFSLEQLHRQLNHIQKRVRKRWRLFL